MVMNNLDTDGSCATLQHDIKNCINNNCSNSYCPLAKRNVLFENNRELFCNGASVDETSDVNNETNQQLGLLDSSNDAGADSSGCVCRVCHFGREGGPLFYPCKCKGTIKFVHEECLVQWLQVSNKKRCELCLTEFHFCSVYSDGTPARLSSLRVLLGSIQLAFGMMPNMFFLLWVGTIWLILLPFYTSRVYELFFVRRFSELGDALFCFEFDVVLRNCCFGIFLTGTIVCSILMIIVLQDFTRRRTMAMEMAADIDSEGRVIEPGNADNRSPVNNIVDIADRVVEVAVAAAADASDLVEEIQAVASDNYALFEFGNRIIRDHVIVFSDPSHVPQEQEGQIDAPFEISNIDEDQGFLSDGMHGSLEPLNEREIDDRNEDFDFEWDVFVGLRGGIRHGIYTVSLIALVNTLFLLLFQFLPFTIGRLTLFVFGETKLCETKLEVCAYTDEVYKCIQPSRGGSNDHFTLSIGYYFGSAVAVLYILLRKLRELWFVFFQASADVRKTAPDLVQQYLFAIIHAAIRIISMCMVIILELFVLEEVVGVISHVGIMGMSGEISSVFVKRVEMCFSSPFTCGAIHWAVGSVIVVNWPNFVWSLRQIMHPFFHLWCFGWYKANKDPGGLFSELRSSSGDLHHGQGNSESSPLIRESQGNDRIFSSMFGNFFSNRDYFYKNQAPFPESGASVGVAQEISIVSQSFEESIKYVTKVILWSVPAMITFLAIPIQLTKFVLPTVFPFKLGTFREPLAEAQPPLDIFLFHSFPFVMEKLNLNTYLLNATRFIVNIISEPLDLNGFVFKSELDHMRSGFVSVKQPTCHAIFTEGRSCILNSNNGIKGEKKLLHKSNIVRSNGSRPSRVPLHDSLPSMEALSDFSVGSRVDLLGVIIFVVPWEEFLNHLYDRKRPPNSPVFIFSVADSLGYCVPVFAQLDSIDKSNRTNEHEHEHEHEHESLEAKVLDAVNRFLLILDTFSDNETAELVIVLRSRLTSFSKTVSDDSTKDVIALLRELIGIIQAHADLVDLLLNILPEGFGVRWRGGTKTALFSAVKDMARLWRDGNSPPIVAIQDAQVSGIQGRSLVLNLASSLLFEPDCGIKSELLRTCFEARFQDCDAAICQGQFCVFRHAPLRLTLRLCTFGILCFVSVVAALTIFFDLPLLIGRLVFHALGDFLKNDLYYWLGGCFIVYLVIFCFSRVISTALFRDKSGGIKRAFGMYFCWVRIGMKWALAIAIYGIVIPLLVGVLCDLVLLFPFRAPNDRMSVNRVPAALLFQDWALGLAGLKVWSHFVLFGVVGDSSWLRKLEKAQAELGNYDINIGYLVKDVAAPIVYGLLLRICCPFVISHLSARALHLDTYSTGLAVRCAYPFFSVLLLLRTLLVLMEGWINAMHDIVRDKQYMVGKKLQNLYLK